MIRVEDLSKTYAAKGGDVHAIKGISFDIPAGSFFVLVGPSGCGKSTTMRLLAGLDRPDGGLIAHGDTVLACPDMNIFVPANKRKIGMVFQSYAIWPHMSVFANVAYPLKVRHVPKAERALMVEEALELVGLGGLGPRPAPRLSGGQQQRVALARALVGRPDILVLDEPLSNLDAKLRVQMRTELKRLQVAIGVTTVYVTHDQSEALSMADDLVVLSEGLVMQRGAPVDIYNRPRNRFTAAFIGSTNLLPVVDVVSRLHEGSNRVETSIGPVAAWSDAPSSAPARYDVCIRPQRIEMSPIGDGDPADGEENCFVGRVEHWAFLGDEVDGEVRVGSEVLRVQGSGDEFAEMPVGSPVRLRIPPRHCRLISHQADADTVAAGAGELVEGERVTSAASGRNHHAR